MKPPVPVFVGNLGYGTRESELERLFGVTGRWSQLTSNLVSSKEHDELLLHFHACLYHLADCRETLESIKTCSQNVEACLGINFTYMQGMVLCILKINGMLKMQSASFTVTVLDMRNAAYGSNGGGVNPAGMVMGQIRSLQRHCLSATSTPLKQKKVDIEEHFQPYGKVINVRIKSSYAFVQFATQEDATKALEATQRSKLLGKVIYVEYGLKDDDERDDRRGGGGSPKRSLSPAYHSPPIPDYGRPRIPEYDRRMSPATYDRRRSPAAYQRRMSPAAYDRRSSPAAYDRRRSPTAYERNMSPPYDSRSPMAIPSGRKAEEYEKNAETEATKNVCDTMVSRQ